MIKIENKDDIMRKKKVLIIVCYYGELPEWYPLWIKSCEYNPSFDFLIVTDDKRKLGELPYNVHSYIINIKDLKKTFNNRINFEVCINSPYKLCDFKPLYPLAFENQIKEYEFWGHCDMDMIFGDLKRFIKDDILSSNDRIGEYGHLTLYRNKKEIINLYKSDGSIFPYKEVFTNPDSFGFDEMSGMNLICVEKKIKWFRNIQIANMDPYCMQLRLKGHIGEPEVYFWKEGKIFGVFKEKEKIIQKEYAYIHFSGKHPKLMVNSNQIREFFITADGFFPKENVLTEKDFIVWSNFTDKKSEKIDYIKLRVKRIIHILISPVHSKKIWIRKKNGIKKFNRIS